MFMVKTRLAINIVLFLATFIIFLIHGCWDALISLVGCFLETNKFSNSEIIGGILFVITILFGLFYIILSIIKIRKVLKNNKVLSYKNDL